MSAILAEFFDHFSPEEQAFIRSKEAEATSVLLQGQRAVKERRRVGGAREWTLQPQDESRGLAAATEFVGYQRVLARRIDPVCTENLKRYLRQLDRICEGLLAKYGTWECTDALAEMRADAERLAWISFGKQLGGVNTSTTKADAEPRQQQPKRDNGEAPATVPSAPRSADGVKPKPASSSAVRDSEPAAGAVQQPELLPATPATLANTAEDAAGEGTVETLQPWAVNLREAREKTRLSRTQVAISIRNKGVQITASAIKKHEEGFAKPRANVRRAYAAVYQVAEDSLFPPEDSIIPR